MYLLSTIYTFTCILSFNVCYVTQISCGMKENIFERKYEKYEV